jgi:phosphopantetheine adenylyltransferase
MMTGYKWFYVNSRIIKEVVFAGGSVEGLVPEIAHRKLQEKYQERKGRL